MLRATPAAESMIEGWGVFYWTRIWKITRRESSTPLLFTEHERPIEFMGETYEPLNSGILSATRKQGGLRTQSTEYTTAVGSTQAAKLSELLNGDWDDAIIDAYVVDWRYPSIAFFRHERGRLGKPSYDEKRLRFDVEGVASQLRRRVGSFFTPKCRHDLGASGCNRIIDNASAAAQTIQLYDANNNPTTSPSVNGNPQLKLNSENNPTAVTTRYMEIASVTVIDAAGGAPADPTLLKFYGDPADIGSQYEENIIGGDEFDAMTDGGWFTRGQVHWLTGDNAGKMNHIKLYAQPQGTTTREFTLWLPADDLPEAGDTFRLVAGCDLLSATCRRKFANLAGHFGGHEDIPGTDAAYTTPQ